jgi:hypothetical protein
MFRLRISAQAGVSNMSGNRGVLCLGSKKVELRNIDDPKFAAPDGARSNPRLVEGTHNRNEIDGDEADHLANRPGTGNFGERAVIPIRIPCRCSSVNVVTLALRAYRASASEDAGSDCAERSVIDPTRCRPLNASPVISTF